MIPFIKILHIDVDGVETDLSNYFISANIVKVVEAKKNNITLTLFNNYGKLNNQNFKKDDSTIKFYLENRPILSTDTPIMTADLTDISYETDSDGTDFIKLKAVDKTGLFLSKIWSYSYTTEVNKTAPEVIIHAIDSSQDGLDEDEKITFNHVATTKSDGNAFTNIVTLAKVWKPLYEWLNEVSETESTGDNRDYSYWIDEDNDLHWEYPYNKANTILTSDIGLSDTTINVASTTDFPDSGVILIGTEEIYYSGITSTSFTGCVRGYNNTTAASHLTNANVSRQQLVLGENNTFNMKIETSDDGEYNMVIYSCGALPQGYDYLWYNLDQDNAGKTLKMTYKDWSSISRDLFNYEKTRSAWGGSTTNYPTPGGNPLGIANTYTTSWNVVCSSNSEFEDAWLAEIKRRGEAKARAFFRTGASLYKCTVNLLGNKSYYINSMVSVYLKSQNVLKALRVSQIRHNINKDGWVTELTLETDEDINNE